MSHDHRSTARPAFIQESFRGETLPNRVREKMESAFGADFSAVRIHVGPEADSIGALAFAHGSDIFFAPGLYDPHTIRGQQLLGHELAHVLQQRAGLVTNPFGSGIAVVMDDALEAEADHLGRLAAAHRAGSQTKPAPGSWAGRDEGGLFPGGSVVQCAFGGDLAKNTFQYFQKEAGMTFKEHSALTKATAVYTTLDGVKAALKVLRASGPSAAAPAGIPGPVGPAPAIPASWTSTFGPLQLYRAVDLTPGRIKHIRRFSPRTNPVLALPGAIRDLLTHPRGFAEGHVRANYDFVHSAASDETCAGYQSTRAYVYRINVPGMYKYEPPAGGSDVQRPPIIWADSAQRTLTGATKVAFDPRKVTKEIDLIFDIELAMIDKYKKKGAADWVDIDWTTIKAELA
jgi:Domain of unknown function (DUF4157)